MWRSRDRDCAGTGDQPDAQGEVPRSGKISLSLAGRTSSTAAMAR
jgi:hypothetical protein